MANTIFWRYYNDTCAIHHLDSFVFTRIITDQHFAYQLIYDVPGAAWNIPVIYAINDRDDDSRPRLITNGSLDELGTWSPLHGDYVIDQWLHSWYHDGCNCSSLL